MKDTDEIKKRISIEEVIGGYVELERAGSNLKARCPFHNEKTPSFHISPERGSFYCFGCGEKGDIFTFVEKIEGIDFKGALTLLAERAGVTLSNVPQDSSEYDELYDALEKACNFFEREFEKSDVAQKYVQSRGIEDATRTNFRIGFAPNEWHALEEVLLEEGVKESALLAAGLTKKRDPVRTNGRQRGNTTSNGINSKMYDVFRERVIFPLFDSVGRVVAFSGRALNPGDKNPKYLNSPESPIFKKSEILYGYKRAKQAMRKYNFGIIVEGQIDLVLSHQGGFPNTVASSGTSITSEHLALIKRATSNLLIALDNDKAGITSGMKTAAKALSEGMDVKGVLLEDGKDPADVISEDAEEWKRVVREAVPIIELYAKHIFSHEEDARNRAKQIRSQLVPLIAVIPSAIDRAHFTESIAQITGIPMRALETEVEEVLLRGVENLREKEAKTAYASPVSNSKTSASQDRLIPVENLLAGVIVWQRNREEKLIDIEKTRMRLEELREKYERTENEIGEEAAYHAERLFKGVYEGDKAQEMFEREVDVLFLRLEREYIEEKQKRLLERLREAEEVGDSAAEEKLLSELSHLSTELKKFHI